MFGRKKKSLESRIGDFWAWWSESGRALVTTAVEQGNLNSVVKPLTTAVHRIDSDLAWEFGSSACGQPVLVVTGEGVPQLRAIAQRWCDAAPQTETSVMFAPCRLPKPGAESAVIAVVGSTEVGVATARFHVVVDEDHGWVSVGVFHSAFAGLDSDAADQMSFMMLDGVLGEDGVGRWVGPIESLTDAPADSVDASGLRDAVAALAERASSHRFVQWSAETEQGPLVVSARRPLHWLSAPLATTSVVVERQYPAGPDGLPSEETFAALDAEEEHLAAALPVSAQYVAAAMYGGVRRLYFYVAPEDSVDGIGEWASGAGAKMAVNGDPGWGLVANFR